MQFEYIENIIKLLEKFLDKYGGEVIPCTIEEEIIQLEEK